MAKTTKPKAKSRKKRPTKVGRALAMGTDRDWTKRAGQLEREAYALMRASEQCLYMAEAIRQTKRKNARQDQESDFSPEPRATV